MVNDWWTVSTKPARSPMQRKRKPPAAARSAALKRRTKRRTIPAQDGQPAISFQQGGLHASTGTKPGQKISASQHAKAASGALGLKAQKQEQFYRNVLKRGR